MIKKFTQLALISVVLTSCQYHVASGTLINDDKIDTLKNSSLSKEEIIALIGEANIIPDYSPNTWYYVHRDMTRRAFFSPKVKAQKILKLTFEGNNLSALEVMNDSHDKDIRVKDEYTRSKGLELNPFQEYVKNFGRFNKGKKKENRR